MAIYGVTASQKRNIKKLFRKVDSTVIATLTATVYIKSLVKGVFLK